jgi:hypothetical protein
VIERPRRDTLELGGRLLAAGELEAVPPLDDPVALEGRVRMDPRKVRAREDATAQAPLEGGPAALTPFGFACRPAWGALG